jgi:endo-1,4-beta-xylanase
MKLGWILLVCGVVASEFEWDSNETLRAAGLRHNIFMGSQFKLDSITSDAAYKTEHAQQYGLSTVGNQCKWSATHKKQDVYTLENCVASFKYAQSANQQFRGHNLCWGNDNPTWLTDGNWSGADLSMILQKHVKAVMQGVNQKGGAQVLGWDVVNEACVSTEDYEATNKSTFFKNNVWYPKLPNYVDVAFQAAREADPKSLLFYNDYGQNQLTGKAEVVYDMVKSMKDRGIPIDGVGMQQVCTSRIALQ